MKSKKWTVFFCVFLSAIVIAMNQFKVPPVMGALMKGMGLDNAQGGMLMTGYAIAVAILVIPGAFILSKLGTRKTTLVALLCAGGGAALGAFSSGYTMMMVSRCIEGIGSALIAVALPCVVTQYFAPEERGKPMGIQAGFIPAAILIIYNVAVPVENAFGGVTGVWWFTAALCLICFILCAAVVKDVAGQEEEGAPSGEKASLGQVIRTPMILALALCFFGAGFRDMTYATWSPTFFTEVRGISAQISNLMTSLAYLGLWGGTIIAGTLFDKKVSPRKFLLLTTIVMIIACLGCFTIPNSLAVPFMIILGMLQGFVVSTIYFLAPSAVDPVNAAYALAVPNVLLSIGQLAAPTISGMVIESAGWLATTVVVEVGAVAMFLAAIWLLKCKGKQEA
jgi:predicted MFS family arabinose efflux permease